MHNFFYLINLYIKKWEKKNLTQVGSNVKFYLKEGCSTGKIIKKMNIRGIKKVNRQLINYYRKRPDELPEKERYKLPKKYIDEIIKLGTNKTTSQMSGGMIASIINEKLKKDNIKKNGKLMTISKSQVNKILKKRIEYA